MPKAFIYKFLFVADGISLFAFYVHLGRIQLIYIHTYPPFSQHTARTPTPLPQHIHTHRHTRLFRVTRHESPWADRSLRCCPCPTCAHLHTHALPPAGWQAGPVSTQTSRRGELSASLLSLTCVTCPVLSSLQSGFHWVERQNLPGTEPRAAAKKQISCGNELPRAQMGARQLWKDHQRKRLYRWPPTPHQCLEEPWDESAHGILFSSLLTPPQNLGYFGYSINRLFPN